MPSSLPKGEEEKKNLVKIPKLLELTRKFIYRNFGDVGFEFLTTGLYRQLRIKLVYPQKLLLKHFFVISSNFVIFITLL